jgi:hypothetical protein
MEQMVKSSAYNLQTWKPASEELNEEEKCVTSESKNTETLPYFNRLITFTLKNMKGHVGFF